MGGYRGMSGYWNEYDNWVGVSSVNKLLRCDNVSHFFKTTHCYGHAVKMAALRSQARLRCCDLTSLEVTQRR